MQVKTVAYLSILLPFVLILSNCSVMSPDTIFDPDGVDKFTIETEIFTPSLFPTTTTSPSPTNSPMPLPTPTLTFMPTLLPGDAVDLVFNLLNTNGECKFPCFLGDFTPGKTMRNEANSFFLQFPSYLGDQYSISIDNGSFNENIIDLFITKSYDEFYISIGMSFIFSDDELSKISFQPRPAGVGDNLGARLIDVPEFNQELNYYLLDNILREYGQPAQVLIFTYDNYPFSHTPFIEISVILHFPEVGLVIEYEILQLRENDTLIGCSDRLILFNMFLSDPNIPIEDLSPYFSLSFIPNSVSGYRQIEEATGLTLEEFYRLFKEPGKDKCFETPASLWP